MQNAYLDLVKKSILGRLDLSCPEFHWGKESHQDTIRHGQVSGTVLTLVGEARLNQLQQCIQTIVTENIPGDILEAGCWKGGASLFMKACLNTYDHTPHPGSRQLYCADLFMDNSKHYPAFLLTALQPMTKLLARMHMFYPRRMQNWLLNKMNMSFPDEQYDPETMQRYWKTMANSSWRMPYRMKNMFVQRGLDEVKDAFARYNLLDDQVTFVEGWFKDTLPGLSQQLDKLAVLRADGDFYSSTQDILNNLYSKLVDGGYCIIDDYGGFNECRRAVDEFRASHAIKETIHCIDDEAIYWRKACG